jgi:hypothetical protein
MERGCGADFCINLSLILHNLDERRDLQYLRNARRATDRRRRASLKRTIPTFKSNVHPLTIPVVLGTLMLYGVALPFWVLVLVALVWLNM